MVRAQRVDDGATDLGAAVRQKSERLIGVITIDDVVDVIEEEADEDLKALGGVTSDEELSDKVWTIARARFNWLLVNLATAFLALAGLAVLCTGFAYDLFKSHDVVKLLKSVLIWHL